MGQAQIQTGHLEAHCFRHTCFLKDWTIVTDNLFFFIYFVFLSKKFIFLKFFMNMCVQEREWEKLCVCVCVLYQRFSTEGSQPGNGSWKILTFCYFEWQKWQVMTICMSWKFLRIADQFGLRNAVLYDFRTTTFFHSANRDETKWTSSSFNTSTSFDLLDIFSQIWNTFGKKCFLEFYTFAGSYLLLLLLFIDIWAHKTKQ